MTQDRQSDFDPHVMLGVPYDASPELIHVAYQQLQARFNNLERSKQSGEAGRIQRQVRDAYELLSSSKAQIGIDAVTRLQDSRRKYTIQVTASRSILPRIDEDQVIYARVDINPEEAHETGPAAASNLNLTLVLDRSNSMHGARLDRLRGAAHQVIDALSADDYLSVVTFNDRAQVLVAATKVTDKPALKAQVSMMTATGGTEMYHALAEAVRQNREHFSPRLVNHILMLTDGNTYGDEEQCMHLAQNVAIEGIGISAMGLGSDWNDEFLDDLSAATGGTSAYIRTAAEVSQYLNSHVRHLSATYAERLRLIIGLGAGVTIEQAFKISPIPASITLGGDDLLIGILEARRPTSILIQLRMPPKLPLGAFHVARIVSMGDVLSNLQPSYFLQRDIAVEVQSDPEQEPAPQEILAALSHLALYRMQETANVHIKRGEYDEATRRLEKLATRLLALGQGALATHVLQEARAVNTTHMLSAEGKKTIKYNTRQLVTDMLREGMTKNQAKKLPKVEPKAQDNE
jgi:Ca-activated chloride channel family protein